MEYTEIFKLKQMLEEADIPFEYIDRSIKGTYNHTQYQIEFPKNGTERIVSVIQGDGTYGASGNKLEIMGLLTEEERETDYSVCGYLTADDVFARIENAYKELITHEGQ